MTPPARATGLTLIELLVAIAVFAVVATIGYRGLQQTLSARERLAAHSTNLTNLQRSMFWLERDLTSLVARPARDYLGDSQPAFYTRGKGAAMQLVLTRSGRSNVAQLAQSNLQRVSYHWQKKHLLRSDWPRLDAMTGTEPRKMPLFDAADAPKWFFLDRRNRWHRQWPPLNLTGNTNRALPRAVRVELTLPGFGNIERIFITGAGS